MGVIRIVMGIERQVEQTMNRLAPILDVMGGRPTIDGLGLRGTHDQRNRCLIHAIAASHLSSPALQHGR
jgi:hypothetical protein